MSNPGILLLDEGKVNNKIIRVEDNLGESIHIHIGDIRLSLTVSEFYQICAAFDTAAGELFKLEGLDWSVFDKSALDWMWLCEYENIAAFIQKNIRLGDLYTTRPITKDRRISKIVRLKNSLLVKDLRLGKSDINKYSEKNMYGVTPKARLLAIQDFIKRNGYPCDSRLIMIDDNNRIFDGDHRAACLYYLYGDDYVVPVLQVQMKNKENMAEVIKKNRKEILRYYTKKHNKKIRALHRTISDRDHHHFETAHSEICVKFCKYNELIEVMNEKNCKYYLIDRKMEQDGFEVVKTIIVDDLQKIRDFYGVGKGDVYRRYEFLYSALRPIELDTDIGKVLVWDCLCCKSRFENAVLPLDKKINAFLWEVVDEKLSAVEMKVVPELIYVIAHCILEKCRFDANDVLFIKQNNVLLEKRRFRDLMETVFFGFTDELLDGLKNGNYAELIDKYVQNVNY